MKRIDDDVAAHQLNLLIDVLEGEGFEQYEVSNFSKAGFQSRHNSNYWRNKKYLGVGPSAHSYNGESRQYNASNNAMYSQSISQNKVPFTLEVLTREDKINEYLLTTLRTCWGADLNILREQFLFDILSESSEYIKSLQNSGFVVIEDNILRLTRQGRFHADKIASDLFVEER
jgi:oxygen-independent coproporphyrinogen-3 oxidase